jgi:hypothetical protein
MFEVQMHQRTDLYARYNSLEVLQVKADVAEFADDLTCKYNGI